jgi:hypothetical protein
LFSVLVRWRKYGAEEGHDVKGGRPANLFCGVLISNEVLKFNSNRT